MKQQNRNTFINRYKDIDFIPYQIDHHCIYPGLNAYWDFKHPV